MPSKTEQAHGDEFFDNLAAAIIRRQSKMQTQLQGQEGVQDKKISKKKEKKENGAEENGAPKEKKEKRAAVYSEPEQKRRGNFREVSQGTAAQWKAVKADPARLQEEHDRFCALPLEERKSFFERMVKSDEKRVKTSTLRNKDKGRPFNGKVHGLDHFCDPETFLPKKFGQRHYNHMHNDAWNAVRTSEEQKAQTKAKRAKTHAGTPDAQSVQTAETVQSSQ